MNLSNISKLSNLYCKLSVATVQPNQEDTSKVSPAKAIKNIQQIADSLNPNQKIILSHKPIEGFMGKRIPQEISQKPKGLWYACGNDWIEWSLGEGYLPVNRSDFFGGNYIYEVELDKENIKCISSMDQLVRFSKHRGIKYSMPKYETEREVDWAAVAEDYSGIEICPYIYEARFEISWYYGWDVASGCIWDSNAFKSIKLLAKRTEGEDAWEVY